MDKDTINSFRCTPNPTILCVGEVSVGKSTILNSLFGKFLNPTGKIRCTMTTNIFNEKKSCEKNIYDKIKTSNIENKDSNTELKVSEYDIDKINILECKHSNMSIKWIDVPGLNDSTTNEHIKHWLRENICFADVIFHVIDGNSCISKESEKVILHFLSDIVNIDVPIINIVNKIDEPEDEEYKELFEQVEKISQEILTNKGISYYTIQYSAEINFMYEYVITNKTLDGLPEYLKNKLIRNEFGKQGHSINNIDDIMYNTVTKNDDWKSIYGFNNLRKIIRTVLFENFNLDSKMKRILTWFDKQQNMKNWSYTKLNDKDYKWSFDQKYCIIYETIYKFYEYSLCECYCSNTYKNDILKELFEKYMNCMLDTIHYNNKNVFALTSIYDNILYKYDDVYDISKWLKKYICSYNFKYDDFTNKNVDVEHTNYISIYTYLMSQYTLYIHVQKLCNDKEFMTKMNMQNVVLYEDRTGTMKSLMENNNIIIINDNEFDEEFEDYEYLKDMLESEKLTTIMKYNLIWKIHNFLNLEKNNIAKIKYKLALKHFIDIHENIISQYFQHLLKYKYISLTDDEICIMDCDILLEDLLKRYFSLEVQVMELIKDKLKDNDKNEHEKITHNNITKTYVCSACNEEKNKDMYSKNQLKKEEKKCKNCV